MGRGGPVLFAMDVGLPVPGLLSRMGVGIPAGVALQPEMQVPYRDRPIPVHRTHPINTEMLDSGLKMALSLPAPVATSEPLPPGVRLSTLLTTTRDGWIDLGGELAGGGAIFEPDIDIKGPVNLALALELLPGKGLVRPSKPISRVVVLGDADCLRNALLAEAPGNRTFAVNLVHWLAGEDRRLGVTVGTVGKATASRRLALTQQELGTLRVVTLGLLPFLVLLMGIATWMSRRGR